MMKKIGLGAKASRFALAALLCLSMTPAAAFAEEVDAGTDAGVETPAEQVLSSRSWFDHQGSEGAVSVLDDTETNPNIDLGGEHDATSLQNMKAAIAHMKRCNELREQHGLQPLLVSDTMMAIAQSQLDATKAQGRGHSYLYGVGENLDYYANPNWDPFGSWYTREKNLLDNDPNISQNKILHYLAIINPSAKYTGFAVIQDAGIEAKYPSYAYFGQVFGEFIPVKGDAIKSYTVEEFEAAFLAWYAENVFTCSDCGVEYAGEHVCPTYTCETCGETYKGSAHECAKQTCPDCGVEYTGTHECETEGGDGGNTTEPGEGSEGEGTEPDPEPTVCPDCGTEYTGEHECETQGGEDPEPTQPSVCPDCGVEYEGEHECETSEPKPVDISTLDVAVSGRYSYDGKAHKPVVSVSDSGVALVEGEDFEVSYSKSAKAAGTYPVTVTGIGNYTGTITGAFAIASTSILNAKVSLPYTSTAYSGYYKKPSATVKAAGIRQPSSNYKVTYHKRKGGSAVNPKNVGAYYVKVASKSSANTYGYVHKKFTVKPKSTYVSKRYRLNNAFKVKWAKRTAQVDGYQIAYKRSGTSKWYYKTVKGRYSSTKTVKGLRNKKTYWVKVRTYKKADGKTYYSSWSSAKSVKTK